MAKAFRDAVIVILALMIPDAALGLITVSRVEPLTSTEAVVVANDVAYVLDYESRLQIVDVSDPTYPIPMSVVDTPAEVGDMAVADGRLYVASWGEIWVIEVTDPETPRHLGSVALPHMALDLEVVDGRAYLAGWGRVSILDVSDLAAPTLLATISVGDMGFVWVQVLGSLLYVTHADFGLIIFDVSNPSAPLKLGEFEVPGDTHPVVSDLAVVDNLAYVLGVAESLRILDVSDPSSPCLLGSGGGAGSFGGSIHVVDEHVYTTGTFRGLRVFDASDPSAPQELGSLYHQIADLDVGGRYAYAASYGAGLQVIDLSNPHTPNEIGFFAEQQIASRIDVEGLTAYVIETNRGLQLIDISEPSRPLPLGDHPRRSFADVDVVGSIAYLAAYGAGLRILDVANPMAPLEIAFLQFDGDARSVHVAEDIVYLGVGGSGLHLIDVSDPRAPTKLSSVDLPGQLLRGIDVVDSMAYVASTGFGLHIIDVADPHAPFLRADVTSIGSANDVKVVDDVAYVAGIWQEGNVIDISNPDVPVMLARFGGAGAVVVEIVGDLALFAGGAGALWVGDITDPARPLNLGGYNSPDYKRDLKAAGGLVHLVSGGLRIVDFGDEFADLKRIHAEISVSSGGHGGAISASRRGVLPVVLMGSENLRAEDVDLATLAFGPNQVAPAHWQEGHPRDVDTDGFVDIVCHFWLEETGIEPGKSTVCLTGQTFEGLPFKGCDSVYMFTPRGLSRRSQVP